MNDRRAKPRNGSLSGRVGPAILALFLGIPAVWGEQDPHAGHKMPADGGSAHAEPVKGVSIPDVALLDQDGRPVRFAQLISGKTVAINSIFTTCTTICPPMGANFGKLQDLLAGKGEAGIHLISISVDPVVDTPERLKTWASKFGRKPGWTLLTGSKHDVDKLLKALKFFTPDKRDHSPTVLVGNEGLGRWQRAYGLAAPRRLVEMIATVDRQTSTSEDSK